MLIINLAIILGAIFILGLLFKLFVWPIARKDYMYKIKFKNYKKNLSLPIIEFNIKGKSLYFLLDSGCNQNVINEDAVKEFNLITDVVGERSLDTAGSSETTCPQCNFKQLSTNKLVLDKECNIDFRYKQYRFNEQFVVSNLNGAFAQFHDKLHGIVGSPFFEKYRWELDFDTMVVWSMTK